jgi:uncharacterized membrane protein YhiD involved in acid resistance
VDELIKEALRGTAVEGGFTLWEILAALGMAFFLSLAVAYFYRETHRGLSYSVSFVHTMVLMGVTVAVIMLIIGSNIARAFALVGALSIIRFRTAMKEPRDVAFIFITMAIGMATGTGFYMAAIVFTIAICAMIYALFRFDIGSASVSEVLLKLHLPENLDYHNVFNETFYEHLQDHSLISVETIRGGTLLELVYSISFKADADETSFLDALRAINGNNKVALLAGQENVNV